MGYSNEFDGLRIVASRGDNLRPATTSSEHSKGQVTTVVWKLSKLIELAARGELGVGLGTSEVRRVRLAFLNYLFDGSYPTHRYGVPVETTKNLSFAEASAVLSWAFSDRAQDDMDMWLRDNAEELGVPYSEKML